MNQHDRIGTFCEKCRQVICICNNQVMSEKTEIKKYTKKPVTIEAYQITRELLESVLFDGAEYPKGLTVTSSSHNKTNRTIGAWFGEVVTIHDQKTKVIEGDWIITEPDGVHHYPCKPDIFEATYSSGTPSTALQDAVLFKGKTIANGTTVYGTYHYSNDKKHHYILSRENFIETDGRQTLHNKEVSEVVSESIRQINSIKNDLLLQDAAKEKSYTIDEIRKYLLSQDSFGDVMYNLNEESFDEANK